MTKKPTPGAAATGGFLVGTAGPGKSVRRDRTSPGIGLRSNRKLGACDNDRESTSTDEEDRDPCLLPPTTT